MNIIDLIIMHMIKIGIYNLLDLSFVLEASYEDAQKRKLTIEICLCLIYCYRNQVYVTGRDVYIYLYYTLLSNVAFNKFGTTKAFISEGITQNRRFSIHNNYVFNDSPNLKDFLNYIIKYYCKSNLLNFRNLSTIFSPILILKSYIKTKYKKKF
jgi:hypothetical protein